MINVEEIFSHIGRVVSRFGKNLEVGLLDPISTESRRLAEQAIMRHAARKCIPEAEWNRQVANDIVEAGCEYDRQAIHNPRRERAARGAPT